MIAAVLADVIRAAEIGRGELHEPARPGRLKMVGRFSRENTMRRIIQASLLSALLLAPGGCAGRPADTQATAPTRGRDIIAREELDRGQWANA